MVFLVFACLLIGVVAFFHYVQGFFSATLSAMIAVLSAVFAVSYHENVVNLLLKGKMADYAHSIVLCMIFVVSYTVLRVIFDMAVPGNVRTPAIVDKVGAGCMGVVAGVFTVGIFAVAVQMLPFDPALSFLGYSRYELTSTRTVTFHVPNRNDQDGSVNNELTVASLDPDKEKGLLFPFDDWMINTVYHVTADGSLAGERPLASRHPDYLQELFGERLGIQTGARRVALASNGTDPVELEGLYNPASLTAKDGVAKNLRPPAWVPPYKDTVKSSAAQQILVVRIKVGSSASDDDDSTFRFSTGSIHLVGLTSSAGQPVYKDYYPIGTLYTDERTVLLNKPDDFLFVKNGDSFDAVFLVDQDLIAGHMVKDGTFVSVKRFGLIDLSGQKVKDQVPTDGNSKVIRSPVLIKEMTLPETPAVSSNNSQPAPSSPTPTPAPAPAQVVNPTPATPAIPADKPLSDNLSASVVDTLSDGMSLGTDATDRDAKDAAVAGGKISLVGGQIAVASVDPTVSLSQLTSQGANHYGQFISQPGTSLVQVSVHPYTDDFSFLQSLGNAKLTDANGNPYDAMGIYFAVKNNDTRGLYLRYNFEHNLASNPNIATPTGTLDGNFYLIFPVKAGSDIEIKSLTLGDKTQNLSSAVKVP